MSAHYQAKKMGVSWDAVRKSKWKEEEKFGPPPEDITIGNQRLKKKHAHKTTYRPSLRGSIVRCPGVDHF